MAKITHCAPRARTASRTRRIALRKRRHATHASRAMCTDGRCDLLPDGRISTAPRISCWRRILRACCAAAQKEESSTRFCRLPAASASCRACCGMLFCRLHQRHQYLPYMLIMYRALLPYACDTFFCRYTPRARIPVILWQRTTVATSATMPRHRWRRQRRRAAAFCQRGSFDMPFLRAHFVRA